MVSKPLRFKRSHYLFTSRLGQSCVHSACKTTTGTVLAKWAFFQPCVMIRETPLTMSKISWPRGPNRNQQRLGLPEASLMRYSRLQMRHLSCNTSCGTTAWSVTKCIFCVLCISIIEKWFTLTWMALPGGQLGELCEDGLGLPWSSQLRLLCFDLAFGL